jgi:hypothetical protein
VEVQLAAAGGSNGTVALREAVVELGREFWSAQKPGSGERAGGEGLRPQDA